MERKVFLSTKYKDFICAKASVEFLEGTTFAGKIPALKIDYILTDPSIEILDHKIDRALFSDHYPLSALILLPK